MSDNLDELLKLASNAGHETRDDAPQGLQIGDLCSNGYAANRNPRKLFMYVQTLRDSIYGLSIDGQDVYVVRSANRVALVLPRDTPNYWRTWELLTKQLPLVSLVLVVLLSGCLTASKIHRWEFALLGWARKGNQECVESVKVASTYLVNANQRLQGATGATDVQTDGEAKKLMQDAAAKCGEVVP